MEGRRASKPCLGLSQGKVQNCDRHAPQSHPTLTTSEPVVLTPIEEEKEMEVVAKMEDDGLSISIKVPETVLHEPSGATASTPRRAPHGYLRVTIEPCVTDKVDDEKPQACNMLKESLALREKYLFKPNVPAWERPGNNQPLDPWCTDDIHAAPSAHVFKSENGVIVVYENQQGAQEVISIVSLPTHPNKIFALSIKRLKKIDILMEGCVLCQNSRRIIVDYWT